MRKWRRRKFTIAIGSNSAAKGQMRMVRGLFVGLATVDLIYEVDEFPAPNTKVAARSQQIFAGGPATNACVTFAHLGGAAALVTVLGRHVLAEAARAELRRYAIEVLDLNPQFDEAPALSSVTVDRQGRRNVVSANAVRLPVPRVEPEAGCIRQAGIVLADGHHMQACLAWARAAHEQGKPVVLDGGSWKDGTDALLPYVHTAICSADFRPPACASEDEVIAWLRARGVRQVAITRGPEPVRYATEVEAGTIPIPHVDVVDTMGAGDVFHGAYCWHAAQGRGFVEALSEAARLASDSCRWRGPRQWMRARS